MAAAGLALVIPTDLSADGGQGLMFQPRRFAKLLAEFFALLTSKTKNSYWHASGPISATNLASDEQGDFRYSAADRQ